MKHHAGAPLRNAAWFDALTLWSSVVCCVLLLVFSACSSGRDEPGSVDRAVHSIAVSGVLSFSDGTPVSSREVAYRMIIDGTKIFDSEKGFCVGVSEHEPGTFLRSIESGGRGEYDLQTPLSEFHAVVAPKCLATAIESDKLREIRLQASVPADSDTCTLFCSGVESVLSDCLNECSSGSRLILASRNITLNEIRPTIEATVGGILKLKTDLVLSDLGPQVSLGQGVDLVVDGEASSRSARITREEISATSCEEELSCVRGTGLRTLLRFDTVIQNLGTSDLNFGNPALISGFEFDVCHGHYHLENIMVYELVDSGTGLPVVVEGDAVIGRKTGFCFMDTVQVFASVGSGKFDCDYQGISAGWSDMYVSSLPCQFLDVTGVTPGEYELRLTVNPGGSLLETNTLNNTASVRVRVDLED